MVAVLKAIRFPAGYLSVVRNMYRTSVAYILQEGSSFPLYRVQSGVMQGRPLTSTLLLLCIDPLLWLLSTIVACVGVARVVAAADEVAIAVQQMSTFKIISQLCKVPSSISGMTLQLAACEFVLCQLKPPLCCSERSDLVTSEHSFLS